jgi:hypothetical protein
LGEKQEAKKGKRQQAGRQQGLWSLFCTLAYFSVLMFSPDAPGNLYQTMLEYFLAKKAEVFYLINER